jgi:hypothetical protein
MLFVQLNKHNIPKNGNINIGIKYLVVVVPVIIQPTIIKNGDKAAKVVKNIIPILSKGENFLDL